MRYHKLKVIMSMHITKLILVNFTKWFLKCSLKCLKTKMFAECNEQIVLNGNSNNKNNINMSLT